MKSIINFCLDETDNKCYDNTKSDFYKCSKVIEEEEGKKICDECEYPYYLGDEDRKCTLIEECAVSNENSTKCLKCVPGKCLNRFLNLCQVNSYIDEIEHNELC